MIVNTPDGQVQFPDDMSNDDIKGVLQKKYGAPQATPTPTPAVTSTAPDQQSIPAIWNRTEGQSVGDYLKAVTARQFQGADQAAQDYARTAAAMFGGNLLQSRLTGNSLEQEKATTEQAKARLGAMAPITEGALYAMGPGELGVAGRLGGGLVGNVAEGALAGAGGAAAQGEDPIRGGAIGALTGGALAPAAALVNKVARPLATWAGRSLGLVSTPEEVAAATAAARTKAYNEAKQFEFAPSDVNSAYTKAYQSLDANQMRDLTGGMNDKVTEHINGNWTMPSIDASNIDGFGRTIRNSARSSADGVLANRIKENLDNVLQTAKPVSGQNPGEALDVIEGARTKAQQAMMAGDREVGLPTVQRLLKDQYVNPATWAQQQSGFYRPGSQQYNDLSKIVRTAGGSMLPSGYGMSHVAGDIAEVGLAAAGMPSAGIVAGVGTQALKPVLSGVMKRIQRRGLQNRLTNLYPGLTGQSVTAPVNVGEALRALTLGSQAGAGY